MEASPEVHHSGHHLLCPLQHPEVLRDGRRSPHHRGQEVSMTVTRLRQNYKTDFAVTQLP